MNLVNPVRISFQEETRKPSSFEVATKFIIPLLSLIAVIVSALQQHPFAMEVLIGVTLLSLIISFLPRVNAWTRGRAQMRADERTAMRAFPKLRKFVRRFGEFVNTSSGATLHGIAESQVRPEDTGPLMKLGMPSLDIFQGFWSTVNARADAEEVTLANFKLTVSQFAMLIGLYDRFCMYVVFERFPQEIRELLDERTKSKLNEVRERFNAFLNDYQGFLQSFDEEFTERHLSLRPFPRTKPL